MSTSVEAVQDWTAEDVETLAKWMGWQGYDGKVGDDSSRTCYFMSVLAAPTRTTCLAFFAGQKRPRSAKEWNPFLSASADYMVLKRAREVWAGVGQGVRFSSELEVALETRSTDADALCGNAARYVMGDYARSVLTALRSQENDG